MWIGLPWPHDNFTSGKIKTTPAAKTVRENQQQENQDLAAHQWEAKTRAETTRSGRRPVGRTIHDAQIHVKENPVIKARP
jgi:hypothetical protein